MTKNQFIQTVVANCAPKDWADESNINLAIQLANKLEKVIPFDDTPQDQE